jgi:hypothetical protein
MSLGLVSLLGQTGLRPPIWDPPDRLSSHYQCILNEQKQKRFDLCTEAVLLFRASIVISTLILAGPVETLGGGRRNASATMPCIGSESCTLTLLVSVGCTIGVLILESLPKSAPAQPAALLSILQPWYLFRQVYWLVGLLALTCTRLSNWEWAEVRYIQFNRF